MSSKSLPASRLTILHSALCILQCAMSAAMAADIVSAPASFDFDSLGAYPAPRGVAVALPYGEGATVTATAPDGMVSTLAAAVNGTNFWTATAGGVWTLANSIEGAAQFCVRYVGAEQGAGTAVAPWKFVDNTELAELVGEGDAGVGFTFSAEGQLAALPLMECPVGYLVQPLEGGLYRLVAASGGTHGMSLATAFPIETESNGPDRRVKSTGNPLAVAFSGDNWAFGPDAASTLTFTSPGGDVTAVPCVGTGTHEFPIRKHGRWLVTLSATGFETLLAHINWTSNGMMIIAQ